MAIVDAQQSEESKIDTVSRATSNGDNESIVEAGIVRLVNISVRSLDEFKAIVNSLMPADGIIRGLEVYIGKLTAQQLCYLFGLLS